MGKILRYVVPPLLTLVAAGAWLRFGSADRDTKAPDVSGGEYRVGDLRFDIPVAQKVFLNAGAAQTRAAQGDAAQISGFNVLYRPATVAPPAPGASVALAFLYDSRALTHDSWGREDGDGEKGGKFQRPAASQARSEDFYLYERQNADSKLLVSAQCSTFFGAPTTLTRRKNGQIPGSGIDYEFEYIASVALSPQVLLVVSFNDLALKGGSIGDTLAGVEKDVTRWVETARPGQTIGREHEGCGEGPRN